MGITSVISIDNEGPNSMRAGLVEALREGTRVDIHVAFVTTAGIDALRSALMRVAEQGVVRIVTGLYQGFTDPKALSALLDMQASSRGRLSVRLARESGFHRKIYLIRRRKFGALFVGSSNLTADGLVSGGEFNLRLTLPASSVELKRMIEMFDEYWERDSLSVAFSKGDVAAYRKLRGAAPKPFIDNSALAKLISSTHREADQDKAPATVAYWRDSVSGYASARTASIVHEETNWDKKGYLWFTPSNGRHGYRVGDRILLFDRVARMKWAYLIVVTAVTTLPRRTVDGRHFVAFVRNRKTHRRKIGNALWGRLADVNVPIRRRNSQSKSRVSPKQWDRILTVF